MENTKCKLLITSNKKIIQTNIKKVYVEDFDDILENLNVGSMNKSVKDDDLVQILYTSGTTGDPKGVLITHDNLHSNLTGALQVFKVHKRYRMLSLIPLSHIFEQVAGFLGIILKGAKTTHLKSRRSSEIVKVMQNEKVTTLLTVPAFFNLFKNKIEQKANDSGNLKKLKSTLDIAGKLPIFMRRKIFAKIHKVFGGHLKLIVCGGASLPVETEIFWENIGVKVLKGYGLTETSPVITITPENDRVIGSVGKTIPGVKIKLSKDNEILALGRNLTKGYYKKPQETKELFTNGWLKTGDLGEIDANRNLFIRGRVKNMILKPNGINIYPEDIEKILDNHDDIKESCVLGVPHGHDIITTAVILPNKKMDEKELKLIILKINQKLEFHQKIQNQVIWVKKDFPRTLTLKVKRLDVFNQIEKKEHLDTKSDDELVHILAQLSHLNSNEIKDESLLFEDLGLDSLKVIELSTLIEEKLRIEIDEYLIDAKTKVQDLRSLINKGVDHKNKLVLPKNIFWPIWIPLRMFAQETTILLSKLYYTKIKVSGLSNVINIKEQIIIAPNHTSHLDSPLLLQHLPFRIKNKLKFGAAADHFFKNKTFIDRLIRFVFYYLAASFPMSRVKHGKSITSIKQSLEFTGQVVDKGYSLGLYPEGTRSLDGKLGEFKNGIGIIIKETNLRVIPVKMRGLWEICPAGHGALPKKRGPVEIKFGEPIRFSKDLSPEQITSQLRKIIEAM